MTIVITGGSGYIGTALTRELLKKGHTVIVVDKAAPVFTHHNLFFIQCDLSTQPLPYNVLERTDAVVNLAGAPISKKWTPSYKETILKSRVQSTRSIVSAIKAAQSRPTVFISASAIGYYGDTGEHLVDEQGSKGEGFLSMVTDEWEKEARAAEECGVRVVIVRTAPVLGHAGIIAGITKTAAFGFMLRLTSKNYWMSWIHEDDIVSVYLFALETSTLQGVVNAAAPEPIQHRDFVALLAYTLHRKVFGSMPGFVTKRLFGELFRELTSDQRVVSSRLSDKGFSFLYPTVRGALFDICRKKNHRPE